LFITPQQYSRLSGIRPRKRFGQHFLAQPAIAERIVESARLSAEDVVVEIGPGLGALTRFIMPRVQRLHLVELDRDLADYLSSNVSGSECSVLVHQQDAMTFDLEEVSEREGRKLVVVGNLPYNISSPLIFRLLERRELLRRCVFMLQKEVGDRLAAGPGTKEYGVLSVLLGAYGRVTRFFTVGPAQFYPRPKVDSLVLEIDFEVDVLADAPSFEFLRKVVNTAFQRRRKTLQNSLKGLPPEYAPLLQSAFSKAGIDPGRRPETLSSGEFIRLAGELENRASESVQGV
jgi:16S rRNA (adenine1518-N6/adenine1519-N6)-dimethyltransferase